ncbi:MAG: hypothetical protein M3Z09_12775 [Acidobacteriota bacterium]|nr:hypothetical protein [Acidobacteriota bacterium]
MGSGCAASATPIRRQRFDPSRTSRTPSDDLVYPNELCGTQVLIGDRPAGLLYVSEQQINCKVPVDALESAGADIRVVYNGQSSLPVQMKVGFEKTVVSLDRPAYTDMPVWLKVELPFEGWIGYPSVLGPAAFGCNQVEVRRNGNLLPLLPGSGWTRYGIIVSGNVCGSYKSPSEPHNVGRMPLHLLYRFDLPGTYEVRFTLLSLPFGAQPETDFKIRGEWTPIQVFPQKPNGRAEWLQTLREHPPTDAAELLTDTLPGLLGIPDNSSLAILTGYLYHSDASVRRYAMDGLNYWPEDLVSRTLLTLIQTKGTSGEIAYFLNWRAALRRNR